MNRLEHWIAAWLDVLCGAINILTLTYYRPWWDFTYRAWATKRACKKRMNVPT